MNTNLAKLLEGYTDRYPHALEQRFGRIVEKVVELWGTPALDEYFDDLLLVKEGKVREGFPPNVASEIFALSMAYAKWREATTSGTQGAMARDAWEHISLKQREEFRNMGLEFSPKGFERAAEANNVAGVALFLSCGIDADVRDTRGWTPLTISSFDGYERLVALLLRHGARARQADNHGYTPLHWAAFRGHDQVVGMLIDQGADVNAASHSGWTPLMQAATRGHLIVVAKLLAKGAAVNQTTRDGWTPLHKAAANGHSSVVRLLLSKGGDPKIRHPSGATARSLAIEHKHDDIVAMLAA